ncbi:MAG: DUF5606 domain-containing protein [Bacteroidales bacterium]
MDLTEILSIAGKPGLYKRVSQTKTGMIVESLTEGKRFPVFAHERVSSLKEISIFTTSEDMPLRDVFKKIYAHQDGQKAIDHKSSPGELQSFFGDAVPEYDREQVYASDIKKIIMWYNLLHDKDMLEFTGEEEEEDAKEEDIKEDKKEDKKENTKGNTGNDAGN